MKSNRRVCLSLSARASQSLQNLSLHHADPYPLAIVCSLTREKQELPRCIHKPRACGFSAKSVGGQTEPSAPTSVHAYIQKIQMRALRIPILYISLSRARLQHSAARGGENSESVKQRAVPPALPRLRLFLFRETAARAARASRG